MTRQIHNPGNTIGLGAIRRAFPGAVITEEGAPLHYVKATDGWHAMLGDLDAAVVWTDDAMHAHIAGGSTRSTHLDGEVAAAEALAAGICPRCAGTGHVPQFAHIDGGRCYECGGTGKRTGR